MQKPVFYRDRMILVVHAKREAAAKVQKLHESMAAQMAQNG